MLKVNSYPIPIIPKALKQMQHKSHDFITVKQGNFPVIITCPHDGYQTKLLKKRTNGIFFFSVYFLGVTVRDIHTSYLAHEIIKAFGNNRKPYFVNMNVSRKKLDVNREPDVETCGGGSLGASIHAAYHAEIDKAVQRILLTYPFVFILDLHGQGHRKNCAELGYLLNSNALFHLNRQRGGNIIQKFYAESYLGDNCSMQKAKNVLNTDRVKDLSDLIWGENAFGSLLTERGFNCLPSAKFPIIPPKNSKKAKFFSGGYTIKRHCLKTDKPVFGLQIELPSDWRGDFPRNRNKMFIKPKAATLETLAFAIKDSVDIFFKMNFNAVGSPL